MSEAFRAQSRCCRPTALTLVGLALSLTACQGIGSGDPSSTRADSSGAVKALQRVNEAGAKCWPDSAGFQDFRLIPELDTVAGRPRLLLLRKDETQGLPALVIEASGKPLTIETYGPLSSTPTGKRVNADIRRWSAGPLTCRG